MAASGAYNRGILNGGGSLRPDLRNYLTGDVYEIKPLTPYGVVDGVQDLARYITALNTLEPGAPALGAWLPGTMSMPGLLIFPAAGGTVEVYAFPIVGPGFVFYTNNLVRDLALVAVVATAAVLGVLLIEALIAALPGLIAAGIAAAIAVYEAVFVAEVAFEFA